MDPAEVHRVIDALDAIECRSWIEGGWGVDALVGRQTRTHRDLDLAFDASCEPAAVDALGVLGYAVVVDWRPVRFELEASGSRRVDMHPVVLDRDGNGVQAGFDGEVFNYPAEAFVTGRVGGRQVGCLSAELQLSFHRGYAPRPVDVADIALLTDLLRRRVRQVGKRP